MELSLPEVATVLGKSERQVRYLIKTGRLKASKQGGRWSIGSEDLPLTAEQREALSKRIETARQAFEKGLEPAAKAADEETKKRHYSVTDLEAFRNGEAIYRKLCEAGDGGQQAQHHLFDTLNLLTRGCHAFHPADKAARLSEARAAAATTVTHLLLASTVDMDGWRALAERIEQELIPSIAALIAVQERRSRRARFDHFVKRVLKIPHYQRYMDDLVLFCNARAQLEDAREAAKEWLRRERRLRLKHPNTPPKSTKGAYTYLGYRVTRAGLYPTRKALRRMQNRISELVLEGDEERIQRSVAAYRGVLSFHNGVLYKI